MITNQFLSLNNPISRSLACIQIRQEKSFEFIHGSFAGTLNLDVYFKDKIFEGGLSIRKSKNEFLDYWKIVDEIPRAIMQQKC